jgi:hypothetical protein
LVWSVSVALVICRSRQPTRHLSPASSAPFWLGFLAGASPWGALSVAMPSWSPRRSPPPVRGAASSGSSLRPVQIGLGPSPSPSACFSGYGSGSWASLALASGLGLPVVFPVGALASADPAGVLPTSWGSWSPLGSPGSGSTWSGGFRPEPASSDLFGY